MRLHRTARKSLVAVHVAASVGLLGATSSSLLLALTAASTTDARLADDAWRLISLQSAVFGIPLSFTALLSGIALGLGTHWGVLRHRWTTAKLAATLLTIVNGAAVIGPTTQALRDGGGSSPWLLVAALATSVALLATATGLSVFKPGGRRRPRVASTPAGGSSGASSAGGRAAPRGAR